jgi:peptide/nickel transport system ATP-binding protein
MPDCPFARGDESLIERGKAGDPVIEARDLRKWFPVRRGLTQSGPQIYLKAVDGIGFKLHAGEILGLAGESGCGKSTAGMTLLNLHRPTSGEIMFDGLGRIDGADRPTLLAFRRQAQIIFQNPYEALNPRHTVQQSVREPIEIHFPGNANAQREKLIQAMTRAGLLPLETYLGQYPHQLSGGQLQRVAIARAISVQPRFLVADEPVSMLDVSIRAGILNLLRYFAAELQMAVLYISHDLSTMRHICSKIAVMYLGRIVELGPVRQILDYPRHPYTQALVAAVPHMGAGMKRARVRLPGAVPNAADLPSGCRFHPRCIHAMVRCRESDPVLKPFAEAHPIACHLYD